MTLTVPLESLYSDPSTPEPLAGPSRVSYGAPSSHPDGVIMEVVRKLRSARRIVVVCGAGISTAASIPDFRSSTGLFSRDKGKGKHSLKDLFHVKCLSSTALLPHHHTLISELASLSISSQPTAFHKYLKSLDVEDRLLRVYSQNIDMLEAKAGLELGIPPASSSSPRKKRRQAMSPPSTPCRTPLDESADGHTESVEDDKPRNFRAVPLHGTLSSLYCPVCSTSVPLDPYLPLPGGPIPCPTCEDDSSIRIALAERPRQSGFLRPSVVLYGEEHPEGERIGQVVERDLKGTGTRDNKEGKVDFLLVCGTSLSIPGVKRIVKEMAKSLHARPGEDIRTVLVNDEPPKPSAEWEEVFDVFIKGDIQDFTMDYLVNPEYVLPPSTPRKRKAPSTPMSMATPTTKRKLVEDDSSDWTTTPPSKKLPGTWLPTPRPTPPVKSAKDVLVDSQNHRNLFEGSLTPLSEDGNEDLINPFLDIGSHLT